MSRPSTSSNQRNLSLTEELEKLEQSITLTLQEIDHNFSRAHRIVTTSILPVVEQYAEHSRNVWEGSKFWKQFFEASANVSLSGYEELAADETVTEDYTNTDTTETSDAYASSPSRANDDDTITAASKDPATHDQDDDSLLDSLLISPSRPTPRAPQTQTQTKPPTFAQYPSPYEALKREVHATTTTTTTTANPPPSTISSNLPSTPGKQTLPDMSLTPTSSPFAPPTSAFRPSTQQHKDLLLHRVLDKNYRLQATPHAQPRALPHRTNLPTQQLTPKANRGTRQRDSTSPMSSPPIPAPELHSEIFDSPQRRPPRTPGVSVLASGLTPRKTKSARRTGKGWDSDSEGDDDEYGDEGLMEGMSPPKTMQFHVPQSRLLQTPAREASKRIVQDILRTAGGDDVTDEVEGVPSPSIVVGLDARKEFEDSF